MLGYLGLLLALTIACWVPLWPMLFPADPVVRAGESLYDAVVVSTFDYGGLI